MVRMMENGEVVKMSKRTGNAITIKDLIDDIANALDKRQRQLKTQIMRLQDSLECNMPCLLKINRNI